MSIFRLSLRLTFPSKSAVFLHHSVHLIRSFTMKNFFFNNFIIFSCFLCSLFLQVILSFFLFSLNYPFIISSLSSHIYFFSILSLLFLNIHFIFPPFSHCYSQLTLVIYSQIKPLQILFDSKLSSFQNVLHLALTWEWWLSYLKKEKSLILPWYWKHPLRMITICMKQIIGYYNNLTLLQLWRRLLW